MTNDSKVTVALKPMTTDLFAVWQKNLITEYAADKVQAGTWDADTAVAQARTEMERDLPLGLQTEHHHLFTIHDSMTDERVGHLWLFVPDSQFEKSGFIYDLEIVECFRRRGYAAAGMLALDEEARAWGLTRLSLHVFAHNTGAKALYDRLGYAVTGLGMTKQL